MDPDDTRRRLRDLDERVHRLEGYVVVLLSGTAAALLALGCFRTFVTEGDDEAISMMGLVFSGGEIDSSEDRALFIGFLGLVLCTLAAIVHCLTTWSREHGSKSLGFGRFLFWVMLLGSLVPLLLTLEASSDENSHEAGPAMLHYYAGLALYAVLLFSKVRELWLEESAVR